MFVGCFVAKGTANFGSSADVCLLDALLPKVPPILGVLAAAQPSHEAHGRRPGEAQEKPRSDPTLATRTHYGLTRGSGETQEQPREGQERPNACLGETRGGPEEAQSIPGEAKKAQRMPGETRGSQRGLSQDLDALH